MRAAKFIVRREGNANNKYFASNFFFQMIHAGNTVSGPWFTNDQCCKTIARGTMDAGINNVIYMECHSGPKMANSTCGNTIVAGTTDWGSTVYTHMQKPKQLSLTMTQFAPVFSSKLLHCKARAHVVKSLKRTRPEDSGVPHKNLTLLHVYRVKN